MRTAPLVAANRLALFVPAALLAGALGSQYVGGLYPCEMCHWQRWPHYVAVAIAALAFAAPQAPRRALVLLAALAIAGSGLIGVFHAGVEYGWWRGITGCTATVGRTMGTQATLDAIMAAPVIRCDVPQWTMLGISLAGYNAILSLAGAAAVARLAVKR